MDSGSVVLVLVLSSDVGLPPTRAMTATAREQLGPASQVLVQEVTDPPSNASAERYGAQVRADVVVWVDWEVPNRENAFIHVLDAHRRTWVDRSLHFDSADAPAERGRAVGFTILSVASGLMPARTPPPPPPPVVSPPKPVVVRPVPAQPTPIRVRTYVEVGGALTAPTDAVDLTTYGPELAVGVAGRRWGVRGALAYEFGPLSPKTVDSFRTYRLALGATLNVWSRRFIGLSARADLVLYQHVVELAKASRTNDNSPFWSVRGGLEAAVPFHRGGPWGPGVAAIGGLGLETSFVNTVISRDGQEVVREGPLSSVGLLGVRWTF